MDISPTDTGIDHIAMDDAEGWKRPLVKALKLAGFRIDADRALRGCDTPVNPPSEKIAAFCKRWGIKELATLGALVRRDFGLEGHVLVEFEPHRTPGFLKLASMEAELSELLGQDVTTLMRAAVEKSQNDIRRQAILESAKALYAG